MFWVSLDSIFEEGGVLGAPGLPMLNNDTIVAAVRAALTASSSPDAQRAIVLLLP